MEIPEQYKKNLYKASLAFLIIISLYFAVRFLSELKSYDMMNSGLTSITLSGHGEVQAVPDIANVSFSIRNTSKTVKGAQNKVAEIEKKALDVLKTNKIDEKDIKTTNASFYPKYENRYVTSDGVDAVCSMGYCNNNRQVLVGYEASESITVKIRNTDDVGKIMQELGTVGVSDLNGPNFAIDDEDDLKIEARKKAIEDAKEKAKILAKDLGVRLGRISNFSESGYYPTPMYDSKSYMSAAVAVSAPAELPKGENTISSDVSITFEIK
jgi:uncharacterized protein